MENIKKEKYILSSPELVSLNGTEEILNQMKNSVCRIYNNGNGTGFFTKIPYKSKMLPVLITNNHIINNDDILNNKIITLYLNNDKKTKTIKLNRNRLTYTNEQFDVTIIEIKEDIDNFSKNYLELDDEIINYFNLNKKENPIYISNIYTNNSIYLINYPENNDVAVSYGKPPNISESKIMHFCTTKEGSSGSPILLIKNQKLIGIHYGSSIKNDYNNGTLLIYSIIGFGNKNNNNLSLKNNYVIGINKENNKGLSINNFNINSYPIKNDKTYKHNLNYKDINDSSLNEKYIIRNNFSFFSTAISHELTKKILESMEKCVCSIIYKNTNIGTGFFCKLPIPFVNYRFLTKNL